MSSKLSTKKGKPTRLRERDVDVDLRRKARMLDVENERD